MSDTIYGNTVGGGSGVETQADWNQNDQTKADYIKNRPFYEESVNQDSISLPLKGIGVNVNMDGTLGLKVGTTYTYTLMLGEQTVGEYSANAAPKNIYASMFVPALLDETNKIYIYDTTVYDNASGTMRKGDGFVYKSENDSNTFDTIVLKGISYSNIVVHKIDNKYIDIDNEYDETSEKPQSGKATKQAVNEANTLTRGIINNTEVISDSKGGFVAGKGSQSGLGGVALGSDAKTNNGVALGRGAQATSLFGDVGSVEIGSVGGIALGNGAITRADCVQIGEGTNKEKGTTQIYDKKLLDKDGFIVPDRFPSGVINDKFELWNDITLGEDVRSITMSKTDNEDPLKIKHLFILFAGSTSGNGPITLRYNSGVIFQLWKSVTGDKNKVVFWVDSEKLKDALYVSYYPSDFLINDGTPDNISMQGLAQHSKSLESTIYFTSNVTNPCTQNTATSWIFGGTSSGEFKLKAGSRILVWGVQDDE